MKNKNVIIPADYNDYIYRLTYYLLNHIIHIIPKSITPNQITLCAFISAMIGTALLLIVQTPAAYLYWIFFNFLWFILDAMDGMHARVTGQSSEYGAFLDHALDNIYFVFMFTAFIIKFNLLHVLYIYIIILRVTAALMVFTVQSHTNRIYLTKFSGGLEFILLNSAMLLSYFFPLFNPANFIHHMQLLKWVNLLHLHQGFFMKCALFPYFIGIPITMVLQFRFVQKNHSQ